LIFLYKFVGDIGKLKEKERNLVLVDLDFFVVKTMETIVFITTFLGVLCIPG
jgi:hypothetical protein